MTTKAATTNGVSAQESKQLAAIDECLGEMALARKRMKSLDARIRRADAAIRRSHDETLAILRHVQASR